MMLYNHAAIDLWTVFDTYYYYYYYYCYYYYYIFFSGRGVNKTKITEEKGESNAYK